jgi:hypothetical protein
VLEIRPHAVYFRGMKTVRDYLQRWIEGAPFCPFTLRLEDGRAIPITRPAHVACSDSGETIAVFLPDGTLEIIAQKSVTSLRESRA